MAFVNSRSSVLGFSDRFAAVVKMVKDSAEKRRVYRQTVLELSNLSDRDLSDLGISRFEITALARATVYTK